MNTWKNEITLALRDYLTVTQLAGDQINPNDIQVEFLVASHNPPSRIPAGKVAIYALTRSSAGFQAKFLSFFE